MITPTLSPDSIGAYTSYRFCRFCGSTDVSCVLDLGNMPLAGGFLKNLSKKTLSAEKKYPLQLLFCQNCFLVQTNAVINQDTLFKNYFYFSSKIKTLVNHFNQIAEQISTLQGSTKNPFVVEIGSNDGGFIKAVINKGYNILGIDPAENVVTPLIKKGVPILNEYFTQKLAQKIVKKYGQADAIYSFNVLAHIENMHDVFSGITTLLKDDGYLLFETHYLGSVLEETQYDMIYHEHQYYYSFLAMENFLHMHQMSVFDVELIPSHAGSIRFFVQKNGGKRKVSNRVQTLRSEEKKKGYDQLKTYQDFSKKIKETKEALLTMLRKLKEKNLSIVGYGASGRGTIIMNYCHLDTTMLSYVVDDSEVKQGAYIPGVHHKIFSSQKLYEKHAPDYVLLFAWSFSQEIRTRHQKYLDTGGKFIIPLPDVNILEK